MPDHSKTMPLSTVAELSDRARLVLDNLIDAWLQHTEGGRDMLRTLGGNINFTSSANIERCRCALYELREGNAINFHLSAGPDGFSIEPADPAALAAFVAHATERGL